MPKTKRTKHAAMYARVSSGSQDIRSQLPDLNAWADSHDGPVKRYRDKASGTTMDRTGWNRLEDNIRTGRIHTVVVWRLDRLGRTASGLTALFEMLRERGVNLVSIKDGLDLSTAAGRLMANVLASVAQFETEVRGERQAAGIEAAKARGAYAKCGRPKGSTKGKPKRAAALRAKGLTIQEVATAMGVHRSTVATYLKAAEA